MMMIDGGGGRWCGGDDYGRAGKGEGGMKVVMVAEADPRGCVGERGGLGGRGRKSWAWLGF